MIPFYLINFLIRWQLIVFIYNYYSNLLLLIGVFFRCLYLIKVKNGTTVISTIIIIASTGITVATTIKMKETMYIHKQINIPILSCRELSTIGRNLLNVIIIIMTYFLS